MSSVLLPLLPLQSTKIFYLSCSPPGSTRLQPRPFPAVDSLYKVFEADKLDLIQFPPVEAPIAALLQPANLSLLSKDTACPNKQCKKKAYAASAFIDPWEAITTSLWLTRHTFLDQLLRPTGPCLNNWTSCAWSLGTCSGYPSSVDRQQAGIWQHCWTLQSQEMLQLSQHAHESTRNWCIFSLSDCIHRSTKIFYLSCSPPGSTRLQPRPFPAVDSLYKVFEADKLDLIQFPPVEAPIAALLQPANLSLLSKDTACPNKQCKKKAYAASAFIDPWEAITTSLWLTRHTFLDQLLRPTGPCLNNWTSCAWSLGTCSGYPSSVDRQQAGIWQHCWTLQSQEMLQLSQHAHESTRNWCIFSLSDCIHRVSMYHSGTVFH
ncbi:UNVERIFIED_CONTAM: hypothetical protein FKN15_026769 [Acipenser sinensis]